MKNNGFGLSDKWRCSEEDEDELEDEGNSTSNNNFLVPSFHRDASNRLSMQFLGESSRFVSYVFFFFFCSLLRIYIYNFFV